LRADHSLEGNSTELLVCYMIQEIYFDDFCAQKIKMPSTWRVGHSAHYQLRTGSDRTLERSDCIAEASAPKEIGNPNMLEQGSLNN
jgi:hypothetical protein